MKNYALAVASFVLFGLLPIYWSKLHQVDSYIVLFHRCFWTFVTLIPILIYKRDFRPFFSLFCKKWPYLILSSVTVAINWCTYIYALNNNHIFEGSLGYFLAPFSSVFLGFLFLREKLRQKQIVAIIVALLAIVYLMISKNIFPKYAIIIAFSFSFYGMLGRFIQTSAVNRMAFDGLLVSLLFVIFFQYPHALWSGFHQYESATQLLLILSGLVTIVPLSLYIIAVKRIPLSSVGILGFIIPTLGFLLCIFYFHEVIDLQKATVIGIVLISMGLYIADLIAPQRKKAEESVP
ncbi:MAG: hypothetical protein KR126chlam2_00997 [Chlamydiae bacterium]|nr:hypothetical protein [Chlamydiota bacterium]